MAAPDDGILVRTVEEPGEWQVISVGVSRCEPGYRGIAAPWGPGQSFPELVQLFGDPDASDSFNPGYAAFRGALLGAGLDVERFGTSDWNPLGDLVGEGGTIVLKPNFIRHWNAVSDPQAGSIESVITHGSIVRAAADYAFIAAGPSGRVIIAEAPQMDCDFDRVREIVGVDELVRFYHETIGRELVVIDLRREAVVYEDGIIKQRRVLPGDPMGYRAVDLGNQSFFAASGLDPNRFRGADYDPGPTSEHHSNGRNAYLLSETVLSSDLVVNLPKLKTHKKTGVTLALKNLVGINGDKNWLPHHSVGSVAAGGDEFPRDRMIDRMRSRATEIARPFLARGRFLGLFRAARKVEWATRGDDFIRSGNWHGNQTTWRMCCDLNRCLYYSDRKGLHLDAPRPVRTVLTVIDGIVAGEGEGPLATRDVPLGAVIAGTDPVAVDLACVRLMGFDEQKLPKLREPMDDVGPRITQVRRIEDVTITRVDSGDFECRTGGLEDLVAERVFRPHAGWIGQVER